MGRRENIGLSKTNRCDLGEEIHETRRRPDQTSPCHSRYRDAQIVLRCAGIFFIRAKALTGHKLLSSLLDPDIIRLTFDKFYTTSAPGTLNKTLAAIYKVYLGCKALGWTKIENPVTPPLREHIKSFRDDFNVRHPRYGYASKDAERFVQYLTEHHSAFALPAELALRCGLRKSEVAGLKGDDIDKKKMVIRVVGKGGRPREIPLPIDLAEKLNISRQYLFTPSRSWKSAFYQAVAKAADALGIDLTGRVPAAQ